MAEKAAAAQQRVWLSTSQALKALKQCIVDATRAKLLD
jgi:hypothetical protein